MVRIEIQEDYLTAKIVKNDRGDWRMVELRPQDSIHYNLIGFGGENSITIHIMTMQSGKTDVVVVYNAIDSYFTFRRQTVNCRFDLDMLNDAINKIIEELTDYPEVLPVSSYRRAA
jgi:hypothetical protein